MSYLQIFSLVFPNLHKMMSHSSKRVLFHMWQYYQPLTYHTLWCFPSHLRFLANGVHKLVVLSFWPCSYHGPGAPQISLQTHIILHCVDPLQQPIKLLDEYSSCSFKSFWNYKSISRIQGFRIQGAWLSSGSNLHVEYIAKIGVHSWIWLPNAYSKNHFSLALRHTAFL